MALSPSIPTSFVPKQTGPVRRQSSSNNILLLIALILLALTLASAAGVFLYSKYLIGVANAKEATLNGEKSKIDNDQVEQFLRLKSRLIVAQTLINQHVELSQFLDTLEEITLSNVRFSTLSIQVAADRSAALSMSGQARTFNALAAQSRVFANQKKIKSAIFSNITPNATDNTVSFALTATIDPSLIVEPATGPGAVQTSVQAQAPATTTVSHSVLPSVTTAPPASTSTKPSL